RSSSQAAATRLSAASSPVSIGRAAMSPVSRLSLLSLGQSNLDCCMSCSREPCALACWSIPTTPPHSPLSRTFRLRPCPSGSKSKSSRPPPAVTLIRFLRGFAQKPIDALLVGPGPLMNNRHVQLATPAARHMLPAIANTRGFPEAGLLMSYGTSIPDAYRQAGVYTGRILKGEKPADLPVIQSSKFEFVINLNTAKAFGLS